MRKITKRSAIIATAAVVAIGGGAAAWAAGWNIGGTGTGDASAASITPLTAAIDLGSTTVYPGLVVNVTGKVNNPNDFPVQVTDANVVPTGVVVTGGTAPSDAGACQNSLLGTPAVLTQNFLGTPIIAKNSTGTDVNSHVVIGDLPQTCAGTHIKVTYSFTGIQKA
jgi:hypothetical protein